MNSETLMLILKIVPPIIAFCTTILSIIACIKTGKWKGLFRKIGAVNVHTQKLVELIEEAETHKGFSGADKLAFVLVNYHAYCMENKMDFQEDEATEEVERLIAMSKNVNIRKENPKL